MTNNNVLTGTQKQAIAKMKCEYCINCIYSIVVGADSVYRDLDLENPKEGTVICTYFPSRKIHKIPSDHWCTNYTFEGGY